LGSVERLNGQSILMAVPFTIHSWGRTKRSLKLLDGSQNEGNLKTKAYLTEQLNSFQTDVNRYLLD